MLRSVVALVSLAALAAPAMADDVHIASISIGEPLQEKAGEYGERELERLVGMLERSLERELGGHLSDDGDRLDITIVNAWPNRPTMRQSSRGLHHSSFSVGGASLEATLTDDSGEVIETFEYSWRTRHIRDASGYATWTDTRRVFGRFADQIADSVEARSGAGS